MVNRIVNNLCIAFAVAVALAASAPVFAAEHGGGGGGGGEGGPPPAVNGNTNPEAMLLNARNPLAIHAGPGKPNVGAVYIPPSLSGKDKKGKAGQTGENVMGGAPAH